MAGQRMARHVEAKCLLLEGQLIGVGQLGDIGQACRLVMSGCRCHDRCYWPWHSSGRPPRFRRRSRAGRGADRPAWLVRPEARGRIARSCDRLQPGNRTRPRKSASRRNRRRPPWSRPARRSRRGSRNGPPISRALTIASTALKPTPLIAPSPKWIFPSVATRKSSCPSLIFGGQHLDAHPPAVVDVLDEELSRSERPSRRRARPP